MNEPLDALGVVCFYATRRCDRHVMIFPHGLVLDRHGMDTLAMATIDRIEKTPGEWRLTMGNLVGMAAGGAVGTMLGPGGMVVGALLGASMAGGGKIKGPELLVSVYAGNATFQFGMRDVEFKTFKRWHKAATSGPSLGERASAMAGGLGAIGGRMTSALTSARQSTTNGVNSGMKQVGAATQRLKLPFSARPHDSKD